MRAGAPAAVVLAAVALALLAAGCGSARPAHPGHPSRPSRPSSALRPRPGTGRATPVSAAIRALEREARPVGRGPRFRAAVRGPVTGGCRRGLGRRLAVHLELFAHNRVVLVPAGIGVAGPVQRAEGRISGARCFGAVVTLDPTGVVLVRTGTAATLATVFRAWGEPLSGSRLAGFPAGRGRRVRIDVDGRPRHGAPGALRLTAHAEIVLEVGPRVPPHRRYAFPPLP